MPKTVPCPACKSKVKVPRDAEAGDTLTCPDCDEAFTPPHLKPKGPSLDDEDAYEVRESREEEEEYETGEREEKRKKSRAIQRAGHQYADRFREKRKPVFGALDIVLLIVSVAAGLGAFVGFIAAKKVPSIGQGVAIVLLYCGVFAIFAYRLFFKNRM